MGEAKARKGRKRTLELGSKPTRLYTHDRIQPGIERSPMKDLRPEDLLLQSVLMFEKCLFNAVPQEATELRRLLENLAA